MNPDTPARASCAIVAVFTPATGNGHEMGTFYEAEALARGWERITQARALAELAAREVDIAALGRQGWVIEGEEFGPLDVPPAEVGEIRGGSWRADPEAQVWACVDFDYARTSDVRGSSSFGRSDRPVQEWTLRRGAALVVAVRPESGEFSVLSEEFFDGPDPARQFVSLAAKVDRVLGHNLLASDYQAIGQVADLPDELISKTVDVLDVLLRYEHSRRPAIKSSNGLSLAELAWLNCGLVRSKAGRHSVWGVKLAAPSSEEKESPIHDCKLTVALWSALVSSESAVTGRSKPDPMELDALASCQLKGEIPCMTGEQWHDERRGEPRSGHRALAWSKHADEWIARITAPVPDRTMRQLREIHARLRSRELVTGDGSDEQLLRGVQQLKGKLNAALRNSPDGGLPNELAEHYAVALWETTHPEIFGELRVFFASQKALCSIAKPVVFECLDEHRAGVRRAARGEPHEIPRHYEDFLRGFARGPDEEFIGAWLEKLSWDEEFEPWRETSQAYSDLKKIEFYNVLFGTR
ncbi:MAG: hypothetical protein ACRC20_09635 [Segniliparus sp.]|uniref:hypothetical protein n=1 Tax=Segniliparus sp. TaxID=2804064 RepID=UPI003F36C6EA